MVFSSAPLRRQNNVGPLIVRAREEFMKVITAMPGTF